MHEIAVSVLIAGTWFLLGYQMGRKGGLREFYGLWKQMVDYTAESTVNANKKNFDNQVQAQREILKIIEDQTITQKAGMPQ